MNKNSIRGLVRVAAAVAALAFGAGAHAGVDVTGTVNELQVAGDGTLYFNITGTTFANAGTASVTINSFCLVHWAGMSLYVPAGDPNYVYYYGLLATSLTKSIPVLLGNISTYNGTQSCDVTKTGYGVVLLKS